MDIDPGFLQSSGKTTGTGERVALQLQVCSRGSDLHPREDGNVLLQKHGGVSAVDTGHSHLNIILLQFNHVLLSIRLLQSPTTPPEEPVCPSEQPPVAEASLLSWCKAPLHG